MKRTIIFALTLIITLALFASCTAQKNDISGAKSIAELAGARIAAQSGTFHEKAAQQIADVQFTAYPEFADLLTALKSGAIDGYVAEEPTALAICLEDSTLDYLHFTNNTTGFTATDADVGIAVGLKTGSELREKINSILAEIPEATRKELMEQMVRLSAGEEITEYALKSEAPAEPVGTFKVAMECAYAPFNWTDMSGKNTKGSVPISGEGKEGLYANGFDVQIAQYIANKLGMKLEIYAIEWDPLVPAVQSGNVDAIIAGMSPTEDREKEIDFTNVYYQSNLVVIIKK